MDPEAPDEPSREALESRVEQLEETVSKMLPSRRSVLTAGAGLAAGSALSGSASGQSAAGQVGTQSSPEDVFAFDLDVGGALQSDLDAGGQAINNAGSVSTDNSYTDSRAADAVVWTDGTTFYADGGEDSIASGSNAATVLQGVVDEFAAADNRDNATVYVADGVYQIDTTVIVREGVRFVLSEGAYVVPTSDVNAIQILPDGKFIGGVIDCVDNGAVGSYSSDAVYLEGTDGGGINFDARTETEVSQTFIKLPAGSGRGVHLFAPASGDSHVTWVTAKNLAIFGGETALRLSPRNPANGTTWVNSNTFSNIAIYQSVYGVRCDCTDGNEIVGNRFDNIVMQPDSSAELYLFLNGPTKNNQFRNMFYWDWGSLVGTDAIEFTSDTSRNDYRGYADLSNEVTNNGQNAVNGQSTVGTAPQNSAKWQGNATIAYDLNITVWDTSTSPNTAYHVGPDIQFQQF